MQVFKMILWPKSDRARFFGKTLILQKNWEKGPKKAKKGLKIGFLDFCAKLSHYFFARNDLK